MKLFGIPIRIHPTFLWLLVFLVIVMPGRAAWVLVVFTFVVLHEVSHCLVAKAHGVHVQDIMLLPIGGMARMGIMPEDAATEFRIAIAGPLLNFAVAAVAYGLLLAGGPYGADSLLQALLGAVLVVNLGLGIFNLLPAFPMDGGRVLRAYLTTKVGYLEATHTAARVGRWVAGLMAIVALAALFNRSIPVNPFLLLLVAGFIYVSGKQEEMSVAARHASKGLWRFFGFGEQMPDGAAQRGPRPGDVPPQPQSRGDVIDVEGRVVPDDDGSAADAFRQLSEDGDSPVRR